MTYPGLHSLQAAQAGMISGLIPVTILVGGFVILKDRPSPVAWLGTILSVLGAILLLGLGHAGTARKVSLGDVEILVAAIS